MLVAVIALSVLVGMGYQKYREAIEEVPLQQKVEELTQREDYTEYDLLIGMDQANLRNMRRICGGDAEGKIRLLMDYIDRPGDVADPWYTGDFETTWQDVLDGCRGLLEHLVKKEKN